MLSRRICLVEAVGQSFGVPYHVCLMLRSHNIQYSLFNHHHPSILCSDTRCHSCSLCTWPADCPQMSTEMVHSVTLGSLSHGGHSGQEGVCGAIGDQSQVGSCSLPRCALHHSLPVTLPVLQHSTHRDSHSFLNFSRLGPSHRVSLWRTGCFRSFQHICSRVHFSLHGGAPGSARSLFSADIPGQLSPLQAPPAPVLGFSGAVALSLLPLGSPMVTVLPGAPACPVWQRCPGHLPVQGHAGGCYQVFQARSEVIRAMGQQWEQSVATNQQWALTDSGR